MPPLPQELISQIVKECIPPWMLKLHIVNPQYLLCGLPKVANLQLVDKSFHNSVEQVLWDQYTGEFDGRCDLYEYQGNTFEKDEHIYTFLSRVPQIIWNRTVKLHLDADFGKGPTRLLAEVPMPRLQLVTLVHGSAHTVYDTDEDDRFRNPAPTVKAALSGDFDHAMLSFLKDLQDNNDTVYAFWVKKMSQSVCGKLRSQTTLNFDEGDVRESIQFQFEIGVDGITIIQRAPPLNYDAWLSHTQPEGTPSSSGGVELYRSQNLDKT